MSNAPDIAADTPTRLQALNPTQSFIVQAPAGSGKTELLTQRYLRLLTTVQQPEQILAITFTRKAASEMRNRVLQSLTNARHQPRPAQPHAAHNWDLAQAALQVDQAQGWQLQAHPARLRVQTIDALNASLARRLPMLARMGASMDIAPDVMPIYEAVCARLLQQLGEGSAAAHLETVLLHLANRVPEFVTMLCNLLAHRDHWLPLLIAQRDATDLRHRIEATLQAVIEQHLQRVQAALPVELHTELLELAVQGARNRLAVSEQDEFINACSKLLAMPGLEAQALPAWRGLAKMLCKQDGGFYLRLNKNHGFAPGQALKQRMEAMLNVLREIDGLAELLTALHDLPSAHFSDAQWQVLQALLQLLPQAVSELLLEFQAKGQVDYVELALRAQQALGTPEQPTDAALALDERLQHILVDEFQDTSLTQMKLLQLLTAGWSEGDGRSLFCVGDPMQSIYRFRQTEVGLFLALQRQGLPTVRMQALQLQTNFRSTPAIVNWVNDCFPRVMPRQDDASAGAVRYSPSLARADAASVDMSSISGVHIHAGITRSASQEAQQIAAVVQQALKIDAQRIAILVAGRSHVGAIALALKQADIAFNAVEIELLQDRSLVQDLLALTRALLHLGDRTAWLACLRAPWCGATLADLHALVSTDAEHTIFNLLSAAAEAGWPDHPGEAGERLARFTTVIKAALAQRARHALRDWVERTWLDLQGPACVATENELQNAEAYFMRLEELAPNGELDDSERLETQLGDLYAQSAIAAAQPARVDIMTIHKAKGLEFDVVLLPSLHRAGGRDATRLLRWTHLAGLDTPDLGANGLVLTPPQAKGDEDDAIYRWLVKLEQQRAYYESGRLLYVAATRAKRELHLFGSVTMNAAGDAPLPPRRGTLLNLLWPQVQQEFLNAVMSAQAEQTESAPLLLQRLPLAWQPPPAEPTLSGNSRDRMVNADMPPQFNWVGETSRHVGTVVHAELEHLVRQPSSATQWQARRAALLLHLAELGVPENLREAALQRVVQAIERTLADARGRWLLGLDATHRGAHAELALSGVIGDEVVNGVIDRSFIDAQGTRWIIDFKTSVHEGGGREAFLQNELDRYRPQMQRYAALMRAWQPDTPIKAALYFPLLGEWRELAKV